MDVGCGYGGLLVSLSPLHDSLILGLELRTKVAAYVSDRIEALRSQFPGKYSNISILRSNAMKFMPNLFHKHQLSKIFFLFPDPHFKKKKHKARIISFSLCSLYAYFLAPNGLVYICTDVEELYNWMVASFEQHPLFERIPHERAMQDPISAIVLNDTEEGRKVARTGGQKYYACFRRVDG